MHFATKFKMVAALCLCMGISAFARAEEKKVDEPVAVRVASYNVEFGKNASPEEIGRMFKSYNLDIIGFCEVPAGVWTKRVGKVLGMKHAYVGKVSSAGHKDKYKSILSRTPLRGMQEFTMTAKRPWNPASTVRAETTVRGVNVAFYSLHIAGVPKKYKSHAVSLAKEILPKEKEKRVIVVGDFNYNITAPSMKAIMKAGMRPTWSDLGIDVSKQFTWNVIDTTKNRGVIDHILYNTASGAKATDGRIIELEKPLSDHKPIWAEITFPK
ncbi:MAG: endonuclease/exonuclease/phosphatase family protein [Planctomycetia bacterium]|jgi:endonuclease/exonuclease/phosphatase family metal-dependent hydrolase